jgi:hypothetical protein
MNSLYIIFVVFFLAVALTSGFALYRLNKTIISSIIQSTDYTTKPGKCILTTTYSISGSNITSKVTTPGSIQWTVNQNVPIYINPLDLSQPKYAPQDVFTILYICTCASLIGLIFSVYISISTK